MREVINTMRAACAASLLLCCGAAMGQNELPTALSGKLAPIEAIELIEVAAVKIENELAKDTQTFGKEKPKRFAVPNEVDLTPENSGIWEDAGNGFAVWRLRLSADRAMSINLGFTDYELPEKATVFVYNEKMSDMVGPYTSTHNNIHNELWTPVVPGEDVIVELTVPMEFFHDVRLRIGSVNAAYRPLGLRNDDGTVNSGVQKSGSCNLDVICGAADGFPEVDAWRGQIPAIGAYTINGSDNCTGSLVNNTAQDGRPLFITANHCGADTSPAGIVVYWNYESPTCRAPGSGASGTPIPRVGFPTTSGSTLLMTTGGGIAGTPDTALVELNTDAATLATIGVTYNGWDRREQTYPSVVTIHHPGVDEKRISFENQAVTRTDYLGDPDLGAGGSHWRIEDWDTGTTEGGSSGSPLFSPEMRVIGVLSGGFASCSSQTEDWYGRLPVAWDGASAAVRLRDHLDPLGTGALTLDGLGAGPIPFLTAGPLGDIDGCGPVGGPFVDGMGSTTITNATEANANYTVSVSTEDASGMIMLSGDLGGTLMDGDDATFSIALNSGVANGLSTGTYTSTIMISDTTNSQDYFRDVVLNVGNCNSTLPLPIPDQGSVEAEITIFDDLCIEDLNTSIGITHTFEGDLIVELTSPEGTTVRLYNQSGGSGADINETYDDNGTNAEGPGSMADFEGENAMGIWTLFVSDNAGQDTGTLDTWSLDITSSGPVCAPSVDDISASARDAEPETITLIGSGGMGALTYSIGSLPTNGSLIDPSTASVITTVPHALAGATVTYVSAPNFGGNDGFIYNADDGSMTSADGNVTVSVDASDAVASFNMDANPGWSTDGGWAFGVPAGSGGDPTSGNTGSNVYGYNLAGAYGNNIDPTEYLTTGSIDYTGVTNASLCFERWLGVETSQFDQATVEVSNNGSTWTTLYTNPTTTFQDTAWSTQTFDISAIADNQATVFVRWGLNTDGSVTRSGWNVDDVVFKGDGVSSDPTGGCCLSDSTCVLTTDDGCTALGGSYNGDGSDCSGCGSVNTCVADFDNDGDVDLGDFGVFGAAFNSMAGDMNYNAAADFDNDGDVDLGDFGVFGAEFGRTDCLTAK